MKKNAHQDELKGLAPRLQALRERMPDVQPPSGYYEQMTEAVMQKVQTADAAGVRKLPARQWLSIAAVLVLSVLAAWWLFGTPSPTSPMADLDWDAIPTEEVQTYVLYHIDEFELDWIIQGQASEVVPDYDLSDEVIRSYLEEEWEEESLDDWEDVF